MEGGKGAHDRRIVSRRERAERIRNVERFLESDRLRRPREGVSEPDLSPVDGPVREPEAVDPLAQRACRHVGCHRCQARYQTRHAPRIR